MDKFHNPYHFIPVSQRTDDEKKHDLAVTREGKERSVKWDAHSHDRYDKDSFSGRIICRLKTEGPVVIGAKQEETGTGQPKRIVPFELHERPAIPASTLRGMLSSIIEAASNSALRVFDQDRPLSSRVAMGDKNNVLSAIGMVLNRDNKLYLLPLAMPTMDLDYRTSKYVLPDKFKKVFRENPRMKSYYNATSSTQGYYYLQSKDWTVDGIAASNADLRHPSMETQKYILKADGTIKISKNEWRAKSREEQGNYYQEKTQNKQFLIGQSCKQGDLLTAEQFGNLQSTNTSYERGFLRVLNDKNLRKDQMPKTKNHELFIPYPETVERDKEKIAIPISQDAIDTFHALARERTSEQLDDNGKIKKDKNGKDFSELTLLPFHPLGTKRSLNEEPDKYFLTLKDRDLVYFDVNGTGTEVTRVSFSSIWRVDSGRVGDYFPSELLPFNESRTTITPAELLFGFVQDKATDKNTSLAFKGKVKVSFGALDKKHTSDFYLYKDEPKVLKILGSPKLPCPTLYFKNKTGTGHITKGNLKPSQHEPQGRKDYLRRKISLLQEAVDDAYKAPWLTKHLNENLNQKVKVTPLQPGLGFWFHIDFDNLSKWELGLLCFALQPDPIYRHKIGMGKPLGLGQIQISPVALLKIDRKMRYSSSGLNTSRYNTIWSDESLLEKLPETYLHEKKAGHAEETKNSFSEIIKAFHDNTNRQINSIQVLGNPENVTRPVHPPQIKDRGTLRDLEEKTFTWFVENDKTDNKRRENSLQQLEPITGNDLPALTYIDMNIQHTAGNGGGGTTPAPQGQNGSKDGSQSAQSSSKFSGGFAAALAKAQEGKK